jgi:TATA-binding protein-associated factor Taf7
MLYNMIGHWAFRWKESIYAKDEIDDLCTRLDDGDEPKRVIIEDVLDGVRYKYMRIQCLIDSGLYTESNSDDSENYEATDDESEEDDDSDDEESEEDDDSDDESDRVVHNLGRFRPN